MLISYELKNFPKGIFTFDILLPDSLYSRQEPRKLAFILIFSEKVYSHATKVSTQVCHCAGALLYRICIHSTIFAKYYEEAYSIEDTVLIVMGEKKNKDESDRY